MNRRRRGTKRATLPRPLPNSQAKGQRGAHRACSHARHRRPGLQATYGRPTMTTTPSLRDLEHHEAFVERHIGPNDAEIAHMLRIVGHDSLDAMTDAIVPGRTDEHTSELQSQMRIPYD